MTLTILHTNDLHNKIDSGKLDRIAQARLALGSDSILLDAGDAVGSGNITFRPGGEPILKEMSDAGYDAMAVGNREFHFSRLGFETKVSLARFPVLSANVRSRDLDGAAAPVRDHVVLERGGWRVLIIGLTVAMITERMKVRQFSPYLFDQPLAVGVRRLAELRSETHPDLVIALTHIGLSVDRRLAAEADGLDIIVGGHSHDLLPQGERVGRVLIAQTGCYGHHLGRITVERAGDGAIATTASLEAL